MTDAQDLTQRVTLGALDAQIKATERDLTEFRQDVRRAISSLDSKLDTSSAAMSSRLDTGLAALAAKIDQRSATPWQSIFAGLAVVTTMLIAIGGMAYLPIQRDTNRIETAIAALVDRNVSVRAYESDQKHTNERLDRDYEQLEAIRFRSYDVHGRISSLETASKDQSVRIDAISRRLAEFIRDSGKH